MPPSPPSDESNEPLDALDRPVPDDLDALQRQLDALIGPAAYLCPSCDRKSDAKTWTETEVFALDRKQLLDDAALDKHIDSTLLTCPWCGHTEARKDLEGYLEFEDDSRHKSRTDRFLDRLIVGKGPNPTWRRRLVITGAFGCLALGGLVWALIDWAGVKRSFEPTGAIVLVISSAVLAPLMMWSALVSLRHVLAGRGHRRARF